MHACQTRIPEHTTIDTATYVGWLRALPNIPCRLLSVCLALPHASNLCLQEQPQVAQHAHHRQYRGGEPTAEDIFNMMFGGGGTSTHLTCSQLQGLGCMAPRATLPPPLLQACECITSVAEASGGNPRKRRAANAAVSRRSCRSCRC